MYKQLSDQSHHLNLSTEYGRDTIDGQDLN